MPTLNQIANVVISRQTQAVTQAGFGLQMFLGLHKGFAERLRIYESLEAVAEDFMTDSNEYAAALAAFSADPASSTFAIGRQASGDSVTLTPTVQNSAVYNVYINGTLFTFTSDASALDTEIVAGLIAVINAGAEPVTASGTTTLVLTADVANVPFSVQYSDNLTPSYTASESLTAALTAIAAENNDWYGVTAYTHVKADILEIATYVEAAKKLYIASSGDADNLTAFGSDSTSVMKAANAAAYFRTGILYSADHADYPECTWMSGEFAKDPGQSQWAYKTLPGITVDNLTTTQQGNVIDKKGNTYTPTAGVNITFRGTTAAGEYIDIIRDIDFLVARMQEEIYSAFVNQDKIPYTANGIATIESIVRSQLQLRTDDGILADDTPFTVTVPKVSQVSANDRANRFLPDVKFRARVAGAILTTEIDGIVTV